MEFDTLYRVGYLQNVIFTERPRVDPVEVAVLPTLPGSLYATLRRVQSGRGCSPPLACGLQVRVRNLTYLQPFSPPLIVAHTNVS